jgi:transcriptional regulator with XRE-family HTH domain
MGFYQMLCDLKEDADLTQKQVAEIIGVSTNHYLSTGGEDIMEVWVQTH